MIRRDEVKHEASAVGRFPGRLQLTLGFPESSGSLVFRTNAKGDFDFLYVAVANDEQGYWCAGQS